MVYCNAWSRKLKDDPLTRRVLLKMFGGLATGFVAQKASAQASPPKPDGNGLTDAPLGGYRFLPGNAFLSFAAVAAPGFEIVRASLQMPKPFPQSIADIERHLKAVGRPIHALCALELRNGRPVTRQEFNTFNSQYVERMRSAGLVLGDRIPVARTNVAVSNGSEGHELHAFAYSVPQAESEKTKAATFILSAAPDSRAAAIVAEGDTSPSGLQQKLSFVVDTLTSRMTTMGLDWNDLTGIQLYTIQDFHTLLPKLLLPKLGRSRRYGVQWHHAQPPVEGGEIEVDLRSVRVERTVTL